MTPPGTVAVNGPAGLRGTIDTATWPLDGSRAQVLVQIEGGAPVIVPLEALVRQEDGSYQLTLDRAELERRQHASREPSDQRLVLPVIQEALNMETRPVETGRVRLRKIVHEREELVDPPLWREEVVVERVPVNRVVEGPIPVRYEGDTMIISLLEEVLVVDTRLVLTEEVHITTRRTETHTPERVTLRREDVTIERVDLERNEPHSQGQEESHGEDRDRTL
jgi:uncharacterized protein (TIGR02271 family)